MRSGLQSMPRTARRLQRLPFMAMELPGIVVARQLILVSLDSMGWAVAFRLGGTSIVSTVESHLLLVNELWLAVDEIVHHDDVVLLIVVRSRGNVAGCDANRRDASIIKLDAEEGQVSIARRGRNETAEYQGAVSVKVLDVRAPFHGSSNAIWLIDICEYSAEASDCCRSSAIGTRYGEGRFGDVASNRSEQT